MNEYLTVKSFNDNRYKFIDEKGETQAVMDVKDGKIIKFSGANHGRLTSCFEDGHEMCYLREVHDFIKEKKFEPVNDLEKMGYIRGDDGQIYDVEKLPENFKIKDLDLSYMRSISLPEGIECENLYLFGATSIRIPRRCYIKNMYGVGAHCCQYLPSYKESRYGVRHSILERKDLKGEALEVYNSYKLKGERAKVLDLKNGYVAEELLSDEAISSETTMPSRWLKSEGERRELHIYALRDNEGKAFAFFKVKEWTRSEDSLYYDNLRELCRVREVVEYNTPDGLVLDKKYAPYVLRFIEGMALDPSDSVGGAYAACLGYGEPLPTEYPTNFEGLGVYSTGARGYYYTLQDMPRTFQGTLNHADGCHLDIPDKFHGKKFNLKRANIVTFGDDVDIEEVDLEYAQNVYIGKNAHIKYLKLSHAEDVVIDCGLKTEYIDLRGAKNVVLQENVESGKICAADAVNIILPENIDLTIKRNDEQAYTVKIFAFFGGYGANPPKSWNYHHLILNNKSDIPLPAGIPNEAVEGIDADRIAELRKQYAAKKTEKENIRQRIEANKNAYLHSKQKRISLSAFRSKKEKGR